MTESKSHAVALAVVALAIVGLAALGMQFLLAPKIMLIARPLFAYEGVLFIALAVLLAWFRDWAAHRLVWLCLEIHRLISTLITAAVIGAEGFMHIFGIPHVEGWWIPLLSGGAAATIGAWLQHWRKKPKDLQANDV